jgi:Lon protease-like protein
MNRVPLFLLNTVLFPGASLPLKVFETRYLDMVSDCLKRDEPFGVCLLRSGAEVGAAGEPQAIGTLARVEKWDMPTPGILHILARGGQRFAVQKSETRHQLVIAEVELWEPEPALEIPERYASLVEFLREIAAEDPELLAAPHFNDASWVGLRLAELLPVENPIKQEWLAERDPVARLASILEVLKLRAH